MMEEPIITESRKPALKQLIKSMNRWNISRADRKNRIEEKSAIRIIQDPKGTHPSPNKLCV